MIYVSCQFETPIGRSDYSDYVRALQLDISGCDADGNRILLGKIVADQVLVSNAQVEGMTLFDVCDQDSQGLHEAYVALFDPDGEFQAELNLDDFSEEHPTGMDVPMEFEADESDAEWVLKRWKKVDADE